MTDPDRSGFVEFDRLMELVRRTHAVLDAVAGERSLPTGGADYLTSRTLPHFEGMRAGFQGWLRTEMADLAELRYLVLQGGAIPAPPSNAAERRAAVLEALFESRLHGERRSLTAEAWQGLSALAHARLVFGLLPRLPQGAVRFPAGRRSYADIAVPRSPAELAARIEEIERELWRTATGRASQHEDPAFRRTYGFFDAADRLRRDGLRLAG
ncbi:MAG: hypothetical protein ACXWMU_00020 [Candidatus Limnocylindrales bacterium]